MQCLVIQLYLYYIVYLTTIYNFATQGNYLLKTCSVFVCMNVCTLFYYFEGYWDITAREAAVSEDEERR